MASATFRHPPAANEAITVTPASATSVTILTATATRLPGTVVVNDSNSRLYVRLGTSAASIANHVQRIPARGSWLVPGWYTGAIQGISPSPSAVSGNWIVTEQLP